MFSWVKLHWSTSLNRKMSPQATFGRKPSHGQQLPNQEENVSCHLLHLQPSAQVCALWGRACKALVVSCTGMCSLIASLVTLQISSSKQELNGRVTPFARS